jgi:hypothetical protein
MNERARPDIERRVRRLEWQNRALIVLLCAAVAHSAIATSSAQPTVITASEVRAQRFILLDPNGGVADDWYAASSPTDRDNKTKNLFAPYSGWPYSRP